jgi:heme oxygenase
VEYKSKLRSLAFNLRDPQNPDLRQHVLSAQIRPGALVRMSAADLANKDLAEWRRKIEEEHNKAIELDVDTAAKVWGWEICFY